MEKNKLFDHSLSQRQRIEMNMIRISDVILMTSLPRSTIYHYVRCDEFPRPVKLGARSVAWIREEVEAWLRQKAALR